MKRFVRRYKKAVGLALTSLALILAGVATALLLSSGQISAETPLPSSPTSVTAVTALPSEDSGTAEQEMEKTVTVTVPEDADGYAVIGVLTIEKLAFQMPVIGEVSNAALEVSPCLYAGPSSPEYAGNIVITGHNYRNDSHFGRLDELAVGDIVRLSDKTGYEYSYEVYETETIGADEVDAFDNYEGEYGLSLVTCANNGENRLLVRCRQAK
ncbi:MAG: sortase [Bacillota bacterium]